ncbi:MAG: DEAD/DEAH box helicase, partial [Chloroflexi bacterium]|nr:DEAD/DEAH box helicase [Chloroflexota bacterium]
LAAFPIKIEMLSRFRTTKQQQNVLEGLGNGMVDVVIGTHRLLQKDVSLKALGLLIIDEEQRFGVNHKEYLKKMRREVDVLSLSATPIPRTMYMSLSGLRDISLMETPPEERLPVRTYVTAYDERIIREAILREMERDGQVFFVHNRVQSIEMIASRLAGIIPEAVIKVAHGQMAEGELAQTMAQFAAAEIDVLVCSAIIESGVDMPNANTLIINKAEMFGLTQLYQLRGRVGRGANLSYAYLLYEKNRKMTPQAQQRLQTIYEAAELGAGYTIAVRDLEIRGAGNLLGIKQSGHITAVGFNLYTQLLARAVAEKKAQREGVTGEEIKSNRLPAPRVYLPLKAYIPNTYVTNEDLRLKLYSELAQVDKIEELADKILEFE